MHTSPVRLLTFTCISCVFVVAFGLSAYAQTDAVATQGATPAVEPSFEVASIKTNDSGDINSRLNVQPGGRLTATNVPLNSLIRSAYRLTRLQMVGAPDWADSARFDIAAKAEGNPNQEALLGMMRSLLRERFKLAVHWETRELPVFALVVVRADGQLGPQMKASSIDCAELRKTNAKPPPAPPPTPADPNPMGGCGIRNSSGRLQARGMPTSELAMSLTGQAGRTVVDRTGLRGGFDAELKWTDEPTLDSPGPSLFTAISEQLGLKLDPQRAPVEVLVVDHVQQPTPD